MHLRIADRDDGAFLASLVEQEAVALAEGGVGEGAAATASPEVVANLGVRAGADGCVLVG